MLGGIFNIFKKDKGLANFIPYRNALESIYTALNKILGGDTYVDLSTKQTITSPIISNGNIEINQSSLLDSPSQILNAPASDELPQISEVTLKRLDAKLPGVTPGSLAYGTYSGSTNNTNLITNGNADLGLSDWFQYNDGQTSAPIDGVGGTMSGVSLAINSTNPLKGTQDFNLSYLANSPIGQGCSINFNVQDINKGHQIEFIFRTSQNFKTGNLKIFILDVNSNTSILLTNSIIKKSLNTYIFKAEFAHTGSSELKLCFHIADSNTSSWNMFFDSIEIKAIPASSTLYYYFKSSSGFEGYEPIKLGWPKGDSLYNNNSTFAQKYSGWCHGTGNYKIMTSSQYVDIVFDHITVLNVSNKSKDVVTGVLTSPVSNFNVRIVPGGVGNNSVDNGNLLTDTGYYVYLTYNPSTKEYGGTLSTSRVAPALSPGFTSIQRLGWIRSGNSTGFFPSLQINNRFCFLQKPAVQTTFTTSASGVNSSASVSIISSTVENPSNHIHRSLIANVDLRCESDFTTTTSSYRQLAPINTQYFTTNFNFVPYSAILAGQVSDNREDIWNDVALSQGSTPNYGLSLVVSNGAAVQTTFRLYVLGFEMKNILLT